MTSPPVFIEMQGDLHSGTVRRVRKINQKRQPFHALAPWKSSSPTRQEAALLRRIDRDRESREHTIKPIKPVSPANRGSVWMPVLTAAMRFIPSCRSALSSRMELAFSPGAGRPSFFASSPVTTPSSAVLQPVSRRSHAGAFPSTETCAHQASWRSVSGRISQPASFSSSRCKKANHLRGEVDLHDAIAEEIGSEQSVNALMAAATRSA